MCITCMPCMHHMQEGPGYDKVRPTEARTMFPAMYFSFLTCDRPMSPICRARADEGKTKNNMKP